MPARPVRSSLQTTLRRSATLRGRGIHGDAPARVTLHPADAETGLVFHRTDLPLGRERFIAARLSNLAGTELATALANPDAPTDSVRGTEHVLAALAGLGVDNALIEIDGPELPILDGSAQPFVEALDDAGIAATSAPRRFLEVLRPVYAAQGASYACLTPDADEFILDISIDFADPAVGADRKALSLTEESFRADLARARTFGFVCDAERLWRAGFARAADFSNTVVIDNGRVLNPGGLRFADECLRHKMLDAVGDLCLAGAPLMGRLRTHRGGHALNAALLRALFADPANWCLRAADARLMNQPLPDDARTSDQLSA